MSAAGTNDTARALGWVRPLLVTVGVLLAAYLLIPIAIIFPMAFSDSSFLTWPPKLFSLRWFENFFTSTTWLEALWQSLRISIPVALIATVLGTLAALGVSHVRRFRRTLKLIFIVPLVLPIVTYALGLYDISGRLGLSGSVWPVVVGQAMLAVPLVFVTVSTGLASADQSLPKAAASLGASGRVVLWRIELAMQRPTILAGGLIALAYSFDELIIAYFLLPPGSGTLPVQILASTRETADPTIAAASVVVIGIVLTFGAVLAVVRLVSARRTS